MTLAATLDDIPIAAKIRAEPGWRAVLFRSRPEEANEGLFMIEILVLRVKWWALEAPRMDLPKPNRASLMLAGMFDGPFGGLFGDVLLRSPKLWPLGADGKRIPSTELRRLVPPCDVSDQKLVDEAKAWIEAVNEEERQIQAKKVARGAP